nr:hypothetical protein [Tanacetum cinerariifolium]
MAAFKVLKTQCWMFITNWDYLNDEYIAMTRSYFIQYTGHAIPEFRDTLIQHLESVKKSIDERVQLKREYDSWVNERQMQTTEEKVDTSKALDASSVDTESSRTESKEHDTRSSSGNDAHDDVAYIRPIYNEEPMAENADECHDTCPLPAILTDHQIPEHLYQSLESENRKPMSQPLRNQSVVRQPSAFKSERPRFSKPRCDSQVDVHNDLSKPVTTHYLPKEIEAASAKPHHMIASSNSRISSRNMSKFSSNDMVHNHYLEEAKKKTQERSRNSEPSLMPSARTKSTANGSKPMPRRNTQTSRNWPTTKNSSNDMVHNHYLEEAKKKTQERSRNSEPSLMPSARTKSTANGSKPMPRRNTQTSRNWPATKNSSNHDSCLTKLLNEVNSRAKVPSNKTPKRNKPVEQISVSNKQERHIPTGKRFLIQKTSVVQKKTLTPRSCLRWKPTGKIFKTVGLRWVPTGKIFTSSTTKVDSEPLNGSNADITSQYECEQTLNVGAELGLHDHSNEQSSSKLVSDVVPPANKTATSRQVLELLFHHHITMLRSTYK